MSQPAYKKLPGRGRTWSGRARIWQGEDHLLLVLTNGYVENYRRFFFKDIQGIVVQRTHTGKTWNGIWGGLSLFLGLLILLVQDDVGRIVLACLAAPFVISLIINLALGPTCACYIRTAVQTERVPAISRRHAAEKFIARVEPLIVASQGELNTEQVAMDLALFQAGQYQPPRPTAPS
jgi:hypothetical protein